MNSGKWRFYQGWWPRKWRSEAGVTPAQASRSSSYAYTSSSSIDVLPDSPEYYINARGSPIRQPARTPLPDSESQPLLPGAPSTPRNIPSRGLGPGAWGSFYGWFRRRPQNEEGFTPAEGSGASSHQRTTRTHIDESLQSPDYDASAEGSPASQPAGASPLSIGSPALSAAPEVKPDPEGVATLKGKGKMKAAVFMIGPSPTSGSSGGGTSSSGTNLNTEVVAQAIEAGSPESNSSQGGVPLTSPEVDSQDVTNDGSTPAVADQTTQTEPQSESPDSGVFGMEM